MNLVLEFARKNFKLSRNYLTILVAIMFLSFLIISLYSWFVYNSYLKEEERKIIETSINIEYSLEDSFNYSSHLIAFLASQIEELPSKTNASITKLLRSKLTMDSEAKKLFSWTLFDWIDNKNQLIPSFLENSTHAQNKAFQLDVSNREYIKYIREEPFVLHFGNPTVGIPSGRWIIPAAFGIKDKNNHFLGAIGVGFNIINLQDKIESKIIKDNNLVYIIINNKQEVSIPSAKLNLDKKSYNILDLLHSFAAPSTITQFFKAPYSYDDFSFVYSRKMINRPFTILMGYNKKYKEQEIKGIIIKHASGIVMLYLVFLVILFLLQKIIVRPIIQLSDAAEKIISTCGTENICLPKTNINEFQTLSLRLIDLKNFILKLKSQEDQIKLLNSELEQKVLKRTYQLEQALTVKTEFLNNMSHEIRTPIQGFLGISETLNSSWNQYTDQQKHFYLDIIAKNAKRLASLVGSLLDLTKFNDGNFFLEIHKINLNNIIKNLIDECNSLYLKDRNIQLVFNHPTKIIKIMADEERIVQVLRNLIINSIRYSANNSVITINLSETTLIYDDSTKVAGIHCSITDQGIGIPQDELKSIFDPFIQSSRSKTKAGGTGLGLAICYKIIKAHYGKIWAENNANHTGASFHFIIPVNHKHDLKNHNIIKEQDLIKFKKAKIIMVVDDEETILSTLDIMLTTNNYKIIKANSGTLALELIKKNYKKVDLILLDLMMPDVDGLEVLVKLKENSRTTNIPVIIQSGTASETDKQKCFEYGATAFLAKPYTKTEVLNEIARIEYESK